jgi:hypothetical protein
MGSTLQFDLDWVASRIGSHLSITRYAIAAIKGGASEDYKEAVIHACCALELLEVVMMQPDKLGAHDRDRFGEMYKVAREYQNQFFKRLNLVVLPLTNGEKLTAQISEAMPPKAIVNNTSHRSQGKMATRKYFSETEVRDIVDYINKLNRNPNWQDAEFLARTMNRNPQSVWQKARVLCPDKFPTG